MTQSQLNEIPDVNNAYATVINEKSQEVNMKIEDGRCVRSSMSNRETVISSAERYATTAE